MVKRKLLGCPASLCTFPVSTSVEGVRRGFKCCEDSQRFASLGFCSFSFPPCSTKYLWVLWCRAGEGRAFRAEHSKRWVGMLPLPIPSHSGKSVNNRGCLLSPSGHRPGSVCVLGTPAGTPFAIWGFDSSVEAAADGSHRSPPASPCILLAQR